MPSGIFTMPSFDTVLEADFVEVKNAVEQVAREIGTRFDFKGTSAAVELKDKEITLFGDADFQLQQVEEVLRNKLAKRNVIHKNKASNLKSSLSVHINSLN